jgi:pimeloyl-ACP methyl ester carboxylesterase
MIGLSSRMRSLAAMLICILMSVVFTGCTDPIQYVTQERLQHGYILILPGIEGWSPLNSGIAKGLVEGGCPHAIEIHDWTMAGAVTFPVNLRDYQRNQREAAKIARKLVDYQDRYPRKPIHLVGHSGGGGMAVLALEDLPADRRVETGILLAAALSPDYDLRRALKRTHYGLWNFYSAYDVGFLKAGTVAMGTIDGRHTTAAGAVGFKPPWGMTAEGRELYGRLLHQQSYSSRMSKSGHHGGHAGWASPKFVAQWLAPLILSHDNPIVVP